jgi:hypothetical protein
MKLDILKVHILELLEMHLENLKKVLYHQENYYIKALDHNDKNGNRYFYADSVDGYINFYKNY